jgi:hypothetical protein
MLNKSIHLETLELRDQAPDLFVKRNPESNRLRTMQAGNMTGTFVLQTKVVARESKIRRGLRLCGTDAARLGQDVAQRRCGRTDESSKLLFEDTLQCTRNLQISNSCKPSLDDAIEGMKEEKLEVVRPERFELPTFWFVARRSIQLS